MQRTPGFGERSAIVVKGGLISDAKVRENDRNVTRIGLPTVMARRSELQVKCYPELRVSDCVPFYFCPRSVMLYVIHRANHPGLTYRGGQGPIVHLEADVTEVVKWAEARGRRWAFSLSNAGSAYAEFRSSTRDLSHLDWDAIESSDFASDSISTSGRPVKEGKQAEFLVEEGFSWSLVRRIGVVSDQIAERVREAIARGSHKPEIIVDPTWYYV
jgi:hypothetical protein